ncbi:MAG: acyl-CoA thioesterase [Arenimonas sp.]
MKPEWSAEIELSPAFHDLDPMAVVWHGHYMKYFELARCTMLQKYDYDYPQMRDSGFMWPIVDFRTKYVAPLRYGQKVKVRAKIVEWEFRLKIEYLVTDVETGKALTRAYSVQVAVGIETQEMCFQSPAVLLQRLGIKS